MSKKNDSFSSTRSYKLSMPQMLFGGIAENWFLKEFGDVHWSLISRGYDTDSDKLVDSNGNRLYASFVRLKWESSRSLHAFKENDDFTISADLSRYGNKMFFTEQELVGSRKKIKASMMTVFSARSGKNTELKKAVPISEIDEKVLLHSELPQFAKEYLELKNNSLASDKNEYVHELGGIEFRSHNDFVAEHKYSIEPYSDINGVGLLYFASYPIINDKCERILINKELGLGTKDKDWAQLSSCIARDVFYFGNADPSEKLIYRLENYTLLDGNKISLTSSFYRESDMMLISRQFVVKQLDKGWKKYVQSDELESEPKIEKIESEDKILVNPSVSIEVSELEKSISTFFSKMLGGIRINSSSNLSDLGIESILFMELSEHLNITYGLSTNPSRFYGVKTIEELARLVLFPYQSKPEQKPEKKRKNSEEEIAIVATSFRIPGAKNENEFWEALKNGYSAVTQLSDDRWEWPESVDLKEKHKSIDQGGFIDGIDEFDSLFFKHSPKQAETMDPQQRILMELSWELMENAGIKPADYRGENMGVFIGVSGSDYEQLILNQQAKLSVTGSAISLLANRISYFYDFTGPSKTVDTACSSSLVALHDAVMAIRNGDCQQAIVGGVHIMCNSNKTLTYYDANMLSTEGKCKTFDASANGYVRGEGAILVMLKRKAQAVADGDRILGIVAGSGVNHGGHTSGITVPNPIQQRELITNTINGSKFSFDDLSYIEAHGTGTSLGDPIEINGLVDSASSLLKNEVIANSCGLGSVKTNIGHLEAASGLAGLLKILVSMDRKQLPPIANFNQLNPKIEFQNSPFYVQSELQSWEVKEHLTERVAGVSSFGVGGTNAHVLIESAREINESNKIEINPEENGPYLFILSARNSDSLVQYATNIETYIKENGAINNEAFSFTLQTAREELEERLAFVYSNKEELLQNLGGFLNHQKGTEHYHNKLDRLDIIEQSEKKLGISEIQENLAGRLNELAKVWTEGASIDWLSLYAAKPKRIFKLPNYPFQKKKHWIPKQKRIEKAVEVNKTLVLAAKSTPKTVKLSKEILEKSIYDFFIDNMGEVELTSTTDLSLFGTDSIIFNSLSLHLNETHGFNTNSSEFYGLIDIAEIVEWLLENEKERIDVSNTEETPKEIKNETIEEVITSFFIEELGDGKFDQFTELAKLGVDSIFLTQLSEHLHSVYGLDTDTSKFCKGKSIHEIAELITEEYGTETTQTTNEVESIKLQEKEEVVIVSTSFRIPGASSAQEFWSNLTNEICSISKVKKSRWNLPDTIDLVNEHRGADLGGFIDGIDEFDPTFFNISPVEAEMMDPQQRILMELSWELFENANIKPSSKKGKKIGVFIGSGAYDYDQISHEFCERLSVVGSAAALLSNRISYFYDLKGPSKTIDTACSASLVAMNEAVESIQSGNCSEAVVGGIHVIGNHKRTVTYIEANMLSADGRCHSFDDRANGYVRAEGGVMLLLKPKSKAIEDGDQILGVIKATTVNHGGRVSGVTVPNPKQQSKLILDTLEKANLTFKDISYIEAHGTGTSLGDPIEINGLKQAMKKLHTPDEMSYLNCGLGSVKSNIGHLEGASGLAAMVKILLSMKHKQLPASINFKKLNPKIDLDKSPFYINTQLREWEAKKGKTERIAGLSNFGVGGTNAHAIIESYTNIEAADFNRSEANKSMTRVFALSAKNMDALMNFASKMKSYVIDAANIDLDAFAFSLQTGKEPMDYRLSFLFNNRKELVDKLEEFSISGSSATIWSSKIQFVDINETKKEDLNFNHSNSQEEQLIEIAQSWCKGGAVNWKSLYSFEVRRMFGLPSYPFAKEKYWLPITDYKNASNQTTHVQPKVVNTSGLNGLKFETNLTNKNIFEIDKNVLSALKLPQLVEEVGELVEENTSFILKNVFWTSPETNLTDTNIFETQVTKIDKEILFQLSAKGQTLMHGEYADKVNLKNTVSQIEPNLLEVNYFSRDDIRNLNLTLIESDSNLLQLESLSKGGNTFIGSFSDESKSMEEEHSVSLVMNSIWLIYQLLQDGNLGSKKAGYESLFPYYSAEIFRDQEWTSAATFKLINNGDSCDIYVYDQTNRKCFSIKELKGIKNTDLSIAQI